jgi:hypothetical protein
MFRLFDACRCGEHADCAGRIAQASERLSAGGALVEVRCDCECHEAEANQVAGEA